MNYRLYHSCPINLCYISTTFVDLCCYIFITSSRPHNAGPKKNLVIFNEPNRHFFFDVFNPNFSQPNTLSNMIEFHANFFRFQFCIHVLVMTNLIMWITRHIRSFRREIRIFWGLKPHFFMVNHIHYNCLEFTSKIKK